ncbi:MAG: VOC family protein [Cytophagales bacterium]|nr:MAG: VOC family protein [Cytophagales bacterium]TAF61642.1 MAG: VOC family protein [Cytophagales bacterium]
MSNKVNWFEIAAQDLERAKNFYQKVFETDFTFVDMPSSPMYMFPMDEAAAGAGGALVKAEDNIPSTSGTIIYFSCQDLNHEASRIEPAGGKLLFPKTSLGEFGFMAHFIDTEGNRIGLHSNA